MVRTWVSLRGRVVPTKKIKRVSEIHPVDHRLRQYGRNGDQRVSEENSLGNPENLDKFWGPGVTILSKVDTIRYETMT